MDCFVGRRPAEETRMEMRTAVRFAIFAAHVEPDRFFRMFAEPLHEELEVPVNQAGLVVLFVVSERNEAVFIVHLRFMHAANGPLSGAVEPAADALPARNFKFLEDVAALREGDFAQACEKCALG